MKLTIYLCIFFVSSIILSAVLARDEIKKKGEVNSSKLMTCVLLASGFSIVWPATWFVVIVYNITVLVLRLLTPRETDEKTACENSSSDVA